MGREKPIALVGPMGAGKSTIGKVLAESLNLQFSDVDRVIEERTGADIPWIFDVEGEEGFRRRESEVLEELLNGEQMVLATGGGSVLSQANQKNLREKGLVVYLEASLDQLIERTRRDKRRPLLQVDNPEQKIAELLEQRAPIYSRLAHLTVNTDQRTPKAVAQDIKSWMIESSHLQD